MEDYYLDRTVDNRELIITPQIRMYLLETVRWTRFMSIVGLVIIGFSILGLMFMGLFGVMSSAFFESLFVVIFYAFFLLISLLPILYLFRFSNKMKMALENDDQHYLTDSFDNLKKSMKFYGILTAIGVAFYVFLIAFSFLGFFAFWS